MEDIAICSTEGRAHRGGLWEDARAAESTHRLRTTLREGALKRAASCTTLAAGDAQEAENRSFVTAAALSAFGRTLRPGGWEGAKKERAAVALSSATNAVRRWGASYIAKRHSRGRGSADYAPAQDQWADELPAYCELVHSVSAPAVARTGYETISSAQRPLPAPPVQADDGTPGWAGDAEQDSADSGETEHYEEELQDFGECEAEFGAEFGFGESDVEACSEDAARAATC
ncbi:hypothetical protein PMAC_003151 [Pneumocystis sp. 'macacae']|nr:hypothetical protein PMAC_003151 [Pneumocystis sp. 'macacae']